MPPHDFPPEASVQRPSKKANGQAEHADDLCAYGFWVGEAKTTTNLPYVIKGIFGKGQVIVLWGKPGSGKTFVGMEAACCVGTGERWHGRRTKQGIVLYVAAESARAYLENRISALKGARPELANAEVMIVPISLDLLHAPKGDVLRVVATAAKLREMGEVVLIVIDTLAVTFGGGNENSPEDMGMYVSNVLWIREQTGAAVLIVHHGGKDDSKGMRGHSALLGALDAELTIDGAEGREKILRSAKVRDGDGYTDLFAFTLRPVDLAIDADGDPVRSCVVDAKDEQETKRIRRERKGAGMGKNQRAVLRILEQAPAQRMAQVDLSRKLQEETGMRKSGVYEALEALQKANIVTKHGDRLPIEISLN